MKHRGVLFVLMLFLLLFPIKVHASSENVTITVSADKSDVQPGDTITFEVILGKVDSLGGLEYKLVIPEGLSIIESSISIPTDLETTLDSDGAIIMPSSNNGYKWSYSAKQNGYNGGSTLSILEFSCVVNADSTYGNKAVTISLEDGGCCFDNTRFMNEHQVAVGSSDIIIVCNHSYDDGIITKQPTTTEKGVKTYTCTVCKTTKTEDVEKLPVPSVEQTKEEQKTEEKPKELPKQDENTDETEEIPDVKEESETSEETQEEDTTTHTKTDIEKDKNSISDVATQGNVDNTYTDSSKNDEKEFNVLFIVIPVAVLTVVGGGAFLFFKKKNKI